MRTKYTLTQEDAFKVYTNRLNDVVKSTHQDIIIFRATDDQDRARLVIFKGRSAKPIANYYYPSYEKREQRIAEYKSAAKILFLVLLELIARLKSGFFIVCLIILI